MAGYAKVWITAKKTFLFLLVTGLFLHNVGVNFTTYLNYSSIIIASEENESPPLFPPVTVCLTPPFNPLRLATLGVNLSAENLDDLEGQVNDLVGVDRQMTGRHLLEASAWQLQDMIKEVTVGDIHEAYGADRVTSKFWSPSFTPMGPCLTFTAPHEASTYSLNLTIRLKLHPPGLTLCEWEDNGQMKNYGGPEDCPSVDQYCNSSCVWQQYLIEKGHFFFVFIGSTYKSHEIHRFSSEFRILDGSGTGRNFLKPLKISRLSMTGPKVNSKSCMHECYLKIGEHNARCRLLYGNRLLDIIGNLCVTALQIFKSTKSYIASGNEQSCVTKCGPEQNEYRWVLTEQGEASPAIDVIDLRLVSSSTLKLEEQLIYPLEMFFADMGGSLGLFLGVSMLDIWRKITNIPFNSFRKIAPDNGDIAALYDCSNLKYNHMIKLTSLSGVLAISLTFSLHATLIIQKCMHLTKAMSISITKSLPSSSNSSFTNTRLDDLMALYISSRPLGCQVVSLSPDQWRTFQCMFNEGMPLPPGLIYVGDLPLCSSNDVTLSHYEYFIHKSTIQSYFSEEILNKCIPEVNLTNGHNCHVEISLHENDISLMSVNVICSLGGILGLYFGISLLGPIMSFQNIKFLKQKWVCTICSLLKASVFIFCFFLCIMRGHLFLGKHPINNSRSSKPLEGENLPMSLACVWPPFNVLHLLKMANVTVDTDSLRKMEVKEIRSTISHLIQGLVKQDKYDFFSSRDLWYNIGWTRWDIDFVGEMMQKSGNHFSQNVDIDDQSIMNRCQALFAADDMKHLLATELYGNLIWNFDTLDSAIISRLYLTLQSPDESPVIEMNEMHNISSNFRITEVSSWENLDGDDTSYGKCISRCLDDALVDHVGCCLPWVSWRQDLHDCDVSRFIQFLLDMWKLEPQNGQVYGHFLNDLEISRCRKTCHPKTQIYYRVSIDGKTSNIGSRFTFELHPDSKLRNRAYIDWAILTDNFERVIVIDGYPISQLLSDLGSIIGMTLGWSLFSLLSKVMFSTNIQQDTK